MAGAALVATAVAQPITVQNPGFEVVGGTLTGALDLNLFDGPPPAATGQLGTSGWYGQANSTPILGVLGFRPQLEANASASSTGKGYFGYGLGASLGGLLGAEMPESYIWQPLSGISLLPNTSYVFSMDMDASSLLNLSLLSDSGFGIGVTTGSTSATPGTFYADSLSSPSLIGLALLGGTSQRMSLSFTTGTTVPSGTVGLVAYTGRGTQAVQVSLLTDYRVDNAAFEMIPEPSSVSLAMLGVGALGAGRWRRRGRS